MDGASKFVRGDAIAGLLISAINIIGGLIVGVTEYGMTTATAFETYTLLTVGDGLVSPNSLNHYFCCSGYCGYQDLKETINFQPICILKFLTILLLYSLPLEY